jgi:glutamyl-tRNA reductase
MIAPVPSPAQYLVVGASHRSSTLSLRGRLVVEEAAMPRFLHQLQVRGVPEAAVLSTPERIEVIAAAEDPAAATEAIRRALADQAAVDPGELKSELHAFRGEEAVRHLFAAAAGLDALVLGEPEVAVRLRAALEQARQSRTLGPSVELLIEAALAAAEHVAEATGLGARAAAIAAAATRIAHDIHGDLAKARVLVIGPGDMGERIAQALISEGVTQLVLTGRSATQLEQAARRLRSEIVPLDSLDAAVAAADIVIANMGSHPPAVTADMVRAGLANRRRPLFLIDAAVPGDIERAAGEEEDIFLYDLVDLEKVAAESGAEAEAAGFAAADIVAQDAADFMSEEGGAGGDELALLRRRFEAARAATLQETGDAATATRMLVDRLLPQVAALVREAARRAPGGPPRGGPVPPRPAGKKD